MNIFFFQLKKNRSYTRINVSWLNVAHEDWGMKTQSSKLTSGISNCSGTCPLLYSTSLTTQPLEWGVLGSLGLSWVSLPFASLRPCQSPNCSSRYIFQKEGSPYVCMEVGSGREAVEMEGEKRKTTKNIGKTQEEKDERRGWENDSYRQEERTRKAVTEKPQDANICKFCELGTRGFVTWFAALFCIFTIHIRKTKRTGENVTKTNVFSSKMLWT